MPANSETLAELSAQMCSIYEGAEAEGRDLNEEESEQFDALFQKYKTIEAASRVEITRRVAEPQPVYDGPALSRWSQAARARPRDVQKREHG